MSFSCLSILHLCMCLEQAIVFKHPSQQFFSYRLFEIRQTEQAEHHKDRQYCQVCRSGCPTKFFVCVFCFVSEMQLVCRNDHCQLGIRFCFKWHLTVSMVILLIMYFYSLNWLWCINATISWVYIWKHGKSGFYCSHHRFRLNFRIL